MSINESWAIRAAGFSVTLGIRALMGTLRYKMLTPDKSLDPRYGCETPRIYLFWHEYIFLPLYLRPHCNLSMLLSKHKDADILANIARREGFGCVRGSTKRGGAAALLEMAERSKQMHLTMTPDGPRGPRRKLSSGAIFLASKTGLPIVPLGFGCDRPWRMKSWDRFALPKPFSRARCIFGNEIHIPTNLDRDELEVHRQRVEGIMNDLTTQAEDWATIGDSLEGEIKERRRKCDATAPKLSTNSHAITQDSQILRKSA